MGVWVGVRVCVELPVSSAFLPSAGLSLPVCVDACGC